MGSVGLWVDEVAEEGLEAERRSGPENFSEASGVFSLC